MLVGAESAGTSPGHPATPFLRGGSEGEKWGWGTGKQQLVRYQDVWVPMMLAFPLTTQVTLSST